MKASRTRLIFVTLVVGGCFFASGCALHSPVAKQEPSPAVTNTQAESQAEAAVAPKPPVRAFPRDTLYSLLTAEIAGSRQQYDVALNNYSQQAKETRDPQVAERATMIARYLNDTEAASNNALLWVELAPDDDEALSNAAFALMQAGQLQEAFEVSRQLQNKGKETLFQAIAANAGTLDTTQRSELLNAYLAQLTLTPKDEQLLVGTGLLYHLQGEQQTALTYAQQAVKFNSDSIPATLLETNMLYYLQRTPEALAKMSAMLERHPESKRLRLQYARILAHTDLAEAQQQFEILSAQAPGDSDLLLSLGLLATERKDYDTAIRAFEQLLDINEHLSTAHFYLGEIAEAQANPGQAILHYLQVELGKEFMQANLNLFAIFITQDDLASAEDHVKRLLEESPEHRESILLLYSQALTQKGQLAAAEQHLDRALTVTPKSVELLYARAMLYEQQGRLPAAEQDLRAIIAQEPDSATALNTLGYLLVDRTERLDEARELLQQAINLKPDEPAIIDSFGWLQYRSGNYLEALVYLRRAYAAYPDGEIAAHLGEVLWAIGERDEAMSVWQQGLSTTPEHKVILETMQRLQAEPE